MNNTLNKGFIDKFSELYFTGATLIAFAVANISVLVIYMLIPMFNGSFQAEMLQGLEGGVLTGVTVLFGVVLGAFILSYLTMAFLGVNAIRIADSCEVKKVFTPQAVSLVFSGIITLVLGVVSLAEGEGLAENIYVLLLAFAQVYFVTTYLLQLKTIKKENEDFPA